MLYEEKDLLWDELNLGSLLNSMKTPSFADDLALNEHKFTKTESRAQIGHKKMLEKPAYSVLMSRYQSLPHQPKTIKMTKINRLADPVKGRYTNFEKNISVTQSPVKDSQLRKNNKTQSAFFLTGEDDDEDEDDTAEHYSPSHEHDHNIIENNKRNARNGFASILRTRVEEAHRIDVLQVPLKLSDKEVKLLSSKSQAAVNRQRLSKAAGAVGNRKNVVANKKVPPVVSGARKKAWHENTAIPHLRGDNKKPIAQVVAGSKTRKGGPIAASTSGRGNDATNGRGGRKILSSGYGGKQSQSAAKERVLKKIAGAVSSPSLLSSESQSDMSTAPSSGNVARRLRSKCTIDVLETIEERRRNAAVVESNIKQRAGKSGTRSAPLGSSGRSAIREEDRGDSTRVMKKSSSAQPMTALGRVNKKGVASPPKAHPNSYVVTRQTLNSVSNPSIISRTAVVPITVGLVCDDSHISTTNNTTAIEPSGIISPSFKSNSQYFISSSMMSDFTDDPVSSPMKTKSTLAQTTTHDSSHENDLEDPVRRSENEYADIQSSIERLKQYGGGYNSDEKTKKEANNINQLSKKAVKLGNHFNNAEDLMSKYKNLVNEFD